MTDEKMREDFEKWLNPLGHFWLVNEAVYWEVWQAAYKSAVPDGYCVVPIDPTDEMVEAACQNGVNLDGRPVWKSSVDTQARWKWSQMINSWINRK